MCDQTPIGSLLNRSGGRQAPGGLAIVAALACAAGVTAGEVTLQNDDGKGREPCTCFIAGEHVAAWLTSTCEGRLTTVQIGWGSLFGGQPSSIEKEIHIYRSGKFPDPGEELTDGELVLPELEDGEINEFDVSALEIDVSCGETIVVSLELLNTSNPPLGPAPLHDGEDCQDGKNTVFVIPGGWVNSCLAGVTGDWVIRAVVDCVDEACPADIDATGDVGFSDLLLVLGEWGPCDGCPEDLDCDGDVGFSDLLIVLGAWGPCP